MTGYLGFYGPERPAKRSAGRVLVIALTAIASAICVGHSDAQQPAAAAPGSSGLLSVERIYSGPSLSGQLARGLQWSPDGKKFVAFKTLDGDHRKVYLVQSSPPNHLKAS